MLWYVGGLSKVKNFWSYFQLVWSLLFNSFQNVTIKHCGYWYGGYFYIVCDWSQDWLGSLITIRYHSETMGRFLWLRLVPGCKPWRSRDKFLCLLGHWYNTGILNQTVTYHNHTVRPAQPITVSARLLIRSHLDIMAGLLGASESAFPGLVTISFMKSATVYS